MKKITLILTIFILIVSAQSYAQDNTTLNRSTDQVERYDDRNGIRGERKARGERAHKRAKHRKKAHRQAKRANKRQMRAMRRTAKADGNVSPRERAVMKKERKRMKRKGNRRLLRKEARRKQHMRNRPGNN